MIRKYELYNLNILDFYSFICGQAHYQLFVNM